MLSLVFAEPFSLPPPPSVLIVQPDTVYYIYVYVSTYMYHGSRQCTHTDSHLSNRQAFNTHHRTPPNRYTAILSVIVYRKCSEIQFVCESSPTTSCVSVRSSCNHTYIKTVSNWDMFVLPAHIEPSARWPCLTHHTCSVYEYT